MRVGEDRKLPLRRSTLKVQRTGRFEKVEVTTDGNGLASHAGTGLLVELSDRLGLTKALSEALADTRERFGGHDPGHVVRDLALTLCDGGDCVSDLGALREQPDLFGRVASSATAWRAIERARGRLDDLRRARAKARERAWAAGAAPEEIVLDFDSHLITAHSDKEGATPTWKRGFGFHPLLCYLDETGEALAGVLREGRAGSNTAADHVEVLTLCLEQIPKAPPRPPDARTPPGRRTSSPPPCQRPASASRSAFRSPRRSAPPSSRPRNPLGMRRPTRTARRAPARRSASSRTRSSS